MARVFCEKRLHSWCFYYGVVDAVELPFIGEGNLGSATELATEENLLKGGELIGVLGFSFDKRKFGDSQLAVFFPYNEGFESMSWVGAVMERTIVTDDAVDIFAELDSAAVPVVNFASVASNDDQAVVWELVGLACT